MLADSIARPDRVPPEVREIVTRYLEQLDEALPDRLDALYLVGSVALGDYRPGQSDIDFVAVTGKALPEEELDCLETFHQCFQVEIVAPWLSGIYLTRQDLDRDPAGLSVPFFLEGQFGRAGGFDANPAVWLTLRNHPVVIRGPAPRVRHDAAATRRWAAGNLNTYWKDQAARLEARAAALGDKQRAEAIAWCVPGVLRLAYTIAEDDVISKSGACEYGLATSPERWHPVISLAWDLRNGTTVEEPIPASYIDDTVALMRHVIDEANHVVVEGSR